MNASGLLVPTTSKGEEGERSTCFPLPPNFQGEAVTHGKAPSAANTPLTSPSIVGSDGGEKATEPLLTSSISPSLKETENKNGARTTPQNETSSTNPSLTKEEEFGGGARSQSYGREKAIPPRDWNTAYFQDEGGGDGPAYVEFDEEGSSSYRGGSPPTPPALRWAESLHNLLLDESGEKVFRSYLLQEVRSDKVLDFWYACRGLKEYERSTKNIKELVSLIWKQFIRNKAVKVSAATYEAIEERISLQAFDSRVLDRAQSEVEKEMNDTLYISFLKSDFYLSFLEPGKREGAESPPSPTLPLEGCCSLSHCTNYLPTLHENSEFDGRDKQPARLTSNNLLKSVNYRANIERIKPEANAGFYLKGNLNYKQSPYHVTYVSGHTASLQDSELQSFSSGAHTDDTKSYTDSSVDAHSFSLAQPMSRKELKRQNQRMKENALQNKEPPPISSKAGIHVIPRTMLSIQSSHPRADTNPEEFVRVLCVKLENCQQNQESKERLMQSMCKITHSEDAPEEARREHAVNALPPNILLHKLNEKVQLDDLGASQSILDEHVARVWDSPICSPSSPKQTCMTSPPYKGAKSIVTRQLPHLSFPQGVSTSVLSAHMAKCTFKSGRHHNIIHTAPTTPCGAYPNFALANAGAGTKGRHPSSQVTPGYTGHIPCGYQPKPGYYARRRERGPDVYSTFSSDSGNVPDYHDTQERVPSSHLPKSKSMPEYIENQTGGSTSDGASSNGRRLQGSGTRRCCRRPPADCTDSGVSVVSDSGRSGAPSSSSERVESWLYQSRPFTCVGHASYSVCPGAEKETSKEFQKCRSSKSTHTVAGSISPGMQRRTGGGSTGRRSQCSSSASGNTCVNTGQIGRPCELSRDSPLGQAQPPVIGDRRKTKGGSSSSKSTGGQSSSVGDGSGSNGSTLRKQQKPSKPSAGDLPSVTQISASATSSVLSDVTTIVYSFQDDRVPFIIKVPSRPVTLKKFKQHLHKKGAFRYFFKKFCEDMGMVYEEITDDSEVLPLFEGKVFVQIHKDD